jgi:hypothetical protein
MVVNSGHSRSKSGLLLNSNPPCPVRLLHPPPVQQRGSSSSSLQLTDPSQEARSSGNVFRTSEVNTVFQKDSRGNNSPDSPCKSYQKKPGGMHIWESEEKHEGEASSEAPSVSAKLGYQHGRGGRLAPGVQGAPKTAMHVFYLSHFLFVLTLLPRDPD